MVFFLSAASDEDFRIEEPYLRQHRFICMKIHHLSKLVVIWIVLDTQIVSAGPPFKTDDPQPVDLHHWEIYFASTQAWSSHHAEATCPHFEMNYGAASNLQLHLLAPIAYVHTAEGTHYGYSDTEIGVKYRLVDETDSAPQFGIFPLVEIPTGRKNQGLGSGEVQAYLPFWIQKSWGKFTTYGGAGLWYNPGTGQRNWMFAGWESQYDFSELLTLGAEIYYQTPDAEDSRASAGFGVGGFVNLNETDHILFSVGRTLSGEESVNGYVGFQLTI
jgi:hypothetical protein